MLFRIQTFHVYIYSLGSPNKGQFNIKISLDRQSKMIIIIVNCCEQEMWVWPGPDSEYSSLSISSPTRYWRGESGRQQTRPTEIIQIRRLPSGTRRLNLLISYYQIPQHRVIKRSFEFHINFKLNLKLQVFRSLQFQFYLK